MIKNIIYSSIQKIALTILIIGMSSCSVKKTAPKIATIPLPNIGIQTFGLLKFGSVVVGDFRKTQVSVTNNTADFATFSPTLNAPFSITDISSPCNLGKIPANFTCSFNVNFNPISNGEFSTTLKFDGSSVDFSGKGLQGGDITVSEYSIDLGSIMAGNEVFKSLTLTNTGDFSVNFPSFSMPSDFNLFSNYCGSAIDPKQSCTIKFLVLKKTLGVKNDTISMTSTARGSGTNTIPLTFTSFVTPGDPSGNVVFDSPSFATPLISFTADNSQIQEVTSGSVKDMFGNPVALGTSVTVLLQNLTLVETNNIIKTQNNKDGTYDGRIVFHVKSTKIKGPGLIAVSSVNAFGSIPVYLAAGAPYGSITIFPYNKNLIADGTTQIILSSDLVYDKFGNVIEDGTKIPISVVGGGNLSTNGLVYSPALTASSFSGTIQFTLRSGTATGNATIQARANFNGSDYDAKGDYPIVYIPGSPDGIIPISSGKGGINAVNDSTLISIGPVKDKTGNVIVQNTVVNMTIQNGINLSATGLVLYTDAAGMTSFQLSGSGNRGPITITAQAVKAKGNKEVWAYKDSHLTLQGQKRDDWGLGDGTDNINSGRVAVKYYKATDDPQLFPPVNDVWDEIFDYNKLSSSDGIFYDIERFNGNPISTLGTDPGHTFPVTVPSNTNLSPYVTFIDRPEYIPYYKSPIWYSAGKNILAAPYWSTTPPPLTIARLSACADLQPDGFGNYLYNLLLYTISSGHLGCADGGVVTTTNATEDRLPMDTKSNLFQPSIGYAEDPLACSFDAGQSPIFNFNLGTFVSGADTTRQILISNPNPVDITNLSISFAPATDSNWIFSNVDCKTSLASQETCKINVKFNGTTTLSSVKYTSALSINSNAVSSNVFLSVSLISTGTTTPPDSIIVGNAVMKTNCYAKLVDFGGYNFKWNAEHTGTVAVSSQLTSSYNGRGQVISRVDNKCSDLQTNSACLAGNSCEWTQPAGSDAETPFTCNEIFDTGDYPKKGKGFSPFVAVGKILYNFSGFDPSGDGLPSSDGMMKLDTESGVWTGLSPDPDESIPLSQNFIGSPQSRYEHGMVYVPETTSLYIYGGVGTATAQNGDQSTVYFNDLWQLNLHPAAIIDIDTGKSTVPNIQWKRICDNCVSVDPSLLFSKISRQNSEGPGYSSEPGVANLIWNKARKQVYIYWANKPYVYSFNPTVTNISVTPVDSSSGANFLASSLQVLYNPKQERMYSYFQGNPGANIPPFLKMWDMDVNEKVYTKTKFLLGKGSKQWSTIISPRIKAYGSAGADSSCGDPCPGVSAYLYNYDNSSWDLIGDNTAITSNDLNSQGEITNSWVNGEAQKHISPDGYVEILVMPKGSPSNYNQIHLDSIYLDGTF